MASLPVTVPTGKAAALTADIFIAKSPVVAPGPPATFAAAGPPALHLSGMPSVSAVTRPAAARAAALVTVEGQGEAAIGRTSVLALRAAVKGLSPIVLTGKLAPKTTEDSSRATTTGQAAWGGAPGFGAGASNGSAPSREITTMDSLSGITAGLDAEAGSGGGGLTETKGAAVAGSAASAAAAAAEGVDAMLSPVPGRKPAGGAGGAPSAAADEDGGDDDADDASSLTTFINNNVHSPVPSSFRKTASTSTAPVVAVGPHSDKAATAAPRPAVATTESASGVAAAAGSAPALAAPKATTSQAGPRASAFGDDSRNVIIMRRKPGTGGGGLFGFRDRAGAPISLMRAWALAEQERVAAEEKAAAEADPVGFAAKLAAKAAAAEKAAAKAAAAAEEAELQAVLNDRSVAACTRAGCRKAKAEAEAKAKAKE